MKVQECWKGGFCQSISILNKSCILCLLRSERICKSAFPFSKCPYIVYAPIFTGALELYSTPNHTWSIWYTRWRLFILLSLASSWHNIVTPSVPWKQKWTTCYEYVHITLLTILRGCVASSRNISCTFSSDMWDAKLIYQHFLLNTE